MNNLPTRLPELYPPLADAAMLVRPSASASVADPATGKALSESDFNGWVEKARTSSQSLTEAAYRELAQPSEKTPVAYYGDVEPNVYHDALNKCADGQACMEGVNAVK